MRGGPPDISDDAEILEFRRRQRRRGREDEPQSYGQEDPEMIARFREMQMHVTGITPRDVNDALSRSLTEDSEDSGDSVDGGPMYPQDQDMLSGIPREYPIYPPLGKPAAWPSFWPQVGQEWEVVRRDFVHWGAMKRIWVKVWPEEQVPQEWEEPVF